MNAKRKPLDVPDREQLLALVVRDGERAVLASVGLSKSALHRALAGLPVSAGTHAIVQRDLGQRRVAAAG